MFGLVKPSLTLMMTAVLFSACSTPLSILDPAGTGAAEAASLWWGMFGLFTLVFMAVMAAWIYAVRRVPAPDAHQAATGTDSARERKHQQAWIIGGGIVLPVLAIALLLIVGVPAGNRMAGAGSDAASALHIEVTGYQWWWDVRYPDAAVTLRDEIHIPAGTPIRLTLTSADVIHSFWVPRIGQKLDMIPGHDNELFLHAVEPGVYPGVCAEFCGLAHAHMTFRLHVHTPEDFAAWLTAQQRAGAGE